MSLSLLSLLLSCLLVNVGDVVIVVGIVVVDDVDLVICVDSVVAVHVVVVGLVLFVLFVDVVLTLVLGGVVCAGIVLVVPSVVRWLW